jgi:hypothetical protein
MKTDILTRSIDTARTGANIVETILSPAAVKTRGVKTLLTLHTDDPRIEAQPLYVSELTIGASTHNVIYQASMANTVYAWDADTGELIWQKNLGQPINGTQAIDFHNINEKWGILSTPVIDRARGVLYACSWISTDNSGNWNSGQHFLAALDLKTGELVHPLLNLEGATYDPGPGHPLQTFRSAERKQRAGLAMLGNVVVVTFGTTQETSRTARGWIIAVDTVTWSISATWCSTAIGSGGGIWMSGSAPAIQSDGLIWIVTGNGDFDGVLDFGESVVRLRYTAPVPPKGGSLTVTGSWTPWTDKERTRTAVPQATAIAMKMAGVDDTPKASNFRLMHYLAKKGIDVMAMHAGDWGDQDLGASGIVLIESKGIALVSGKDGILYTIDLANPGNTKPSDLTPQNAAANYAKLASPPILYTFYDATINPATTDPSALNVFAANESHHLHGTPVVWLSAIHGQMHFCGGENGNLRAWNIATNLSSTYLACSSAIASPDSQASPFGIKGGMPGWSIALSANGQQDGVIWAMIPYGDANTTLTNGRLLAYDATQFAHFNDGSSEIVPLWDSQDWGWNFLHPKFNRPVAVDGKVLVPTYDGRLFVLGLA